ncbi:MAG: hypothetical protein U0133_05010 [Gemmatimonadales bacterium]
MSEDNVRLTGGEITRWLLLGLLLVAGLVAFFIYSPRVSPAIRPPASTTAEP